MVAPQSNWIEYTRRYHGLIFALKSKTHTTTIDGSPPSYRPTAAIMIYWNETTYYFRGLYSCCLSRFKHIKRSLLPLRRCLQVPTSLLTSSTYNTEGGHTCQYETPLGPIWEVDAVGLHRIWRNEVLHIERHEPLSHTLKQENITRVVLHGVWGGRMRRSKKFWGNGHMTQRNKVYAYESRQWGRSEIR